MLCSLNVVRTLLQTCFTVEYQLNSDCIKYLMCVLNLSQCAALPLCPGVRCLPWVWEADVQPQAFRWKKNTDESAYFRDGFVSFISGMDLFCLFQGWICFVCLRDGSVSFISGTADLFRFSQGRICFISLRDGSISFHSGMDLFWQWYLLPRQDRTHRSSLLCPSVTVYQHWANQS